MKQFIKDSGMLVCEEPLFKSKVLDSGRAWHLTREQYKNRMVGRTKLSPAERAMMESVLQEVRREMNGMA